LEGSIVPTNGFTSQSIQELSKSIYIPRGINTDALDDYKAQVPFIERRLVYILSLFPSELHIFARPEIRSLEDLRAKRSISTRKAPQPPTPVH